MGSAALDQFDYIIVGAGSAGCVLANRLTEDPGVTVLLIEAGGRDSSLYIQMPTALAIPMNMAKYSWQYESEPEPRLGGRRLHCPRGKVLGGSSSINGMVYVRGNPLDYEAWVELGARGWSYAEVLPYFRKAESHSRGGDDYRGDAGPLHTSIGRLANPLYRAFIEAGVEAGYPRNDDLNGRCQEGFGPLDMTVKEGRRWSAANGYLHPARKRPNLEIVTGALAEAVTFAGNRAGGIRYRRGGTVRETAARREVILAGGPVNSPQLLMLSGIGPGAELARHGIAVRRELPGVGANLMDHLELYLQMACRRPITLYKVMNPISKALIGARWLLDRGGLGGTNHFEAGAFIRSRPGVRWPDIQLHFLPLAISYDGTSLLRRHGFQAHVGPLRSKSRGWVRLATADPGAKPEVRFNYMSDDDDWLEMRAGVRLAREIFAQPAFDPYRGEEIAPGAAVQAEAEIDAFVRDTVQSAYHPCGSCRMGVDAMAVVDPECRVHGVEGLRVVDSSIMPQITSGNLNAPTIMLAEKAADMIKGVVPLPASQAPWYEAEDWRRRQRPRPPLRELSGAGEGRPNRAGLESPAEPRQT